MGGLSLPKLTAYEQIEGRSKAIEFFFRLLPVALLLIQQDYCKAAQHQDKHYDAEVEHQ